jgi:hypothetical protein
MVRSEVAVLNPFFDVCAGRLAYQSCDHLVTMGYVARRPAPDDRRRTLLQLTRHVHPHSGLHQGE